MLATRAIEWLGKIWQAWTSSFRPQWRPLDWARERNAA